MDYHFMEHNAIVRDHGLRIAAVVRAMDLDLDGGFTTSIIQPRIYTFISKKMKKLIKLLPDTAFMYDDIGHTECELYN